MCDFFFFFFYHSGRLFVVVAFCWVINSLKRNDFIFIGLCNDSRCKRMQESKTSWCICSFSATKYISHTFLSYSSWSEFSRYYTINQELVILLISMYCLWCLKKGKNATPLQLDLCFSFHGMLNVFVAWLNIPSISPVLH